MENWICTYKRCGQNANYQWLDDEEDIIRGFTCTKHSKLVCEIHRKKWQKDKAGIVTITKVFKDMMKDLAKGLA
jgi:hypothetical protein